MRILPLNFVIALAISALMAFGLWSIDNALHTFIAFGAFVFFAGTLVPCLGVSYEGSRRGTNLKVLCAVFFAISLGISLLFSWVSFSQTSYIITNALFFLLFLLLANSIYGVKQ